MKRTNLTVGVSTSFLPNNLSVHPKPINSNIRVCFIHRNRVIIATYPKNLLAPEKSEKAKEIAIKLRKCSSSQIKCEDLALKARYYTFNGEHRILVSLMNGSVIAYSEQGVLLHKFPENMGRLRTANHGAFTAVEVNETGIFLGRQNGDVIVLNHNFLQPRSLLNGHVVAIQSLAISGRKLASSDLNGSVVVWDTDNLRQSFKFDSKQGYPCLCLHWLGSKLIAGFGDGKIRIYDATSGCLETEILAHKRCINGLKFHGNKFATVSDDSFVNVFTIECKTNQNVIKCVYSSSIKDRLLVGCCWLTDRWICVTSYDSKDLHLIDASSFPTQK